MEYQFADRVQGLKSSAVRDILKLTQGQSIISFAGGLPAEEHFPIEAVEDATKRVFAVGGKGSLQYGITEGYTPLREVIATRMKRKNMKVGTENILMTTGSQQGIDLLARVYLDPGDIVLVENPTYLAVLQVFQLNSATPIAVQSDDDGMNLEDLEAKIIHHKPKLVYVTPTFSNPGGKVWSLERRKGLLEICKRYSVLILEDDPYGEIQFRPDEVYPPIFSLDEHPDGCHVVYTSTFSKTVAPALRSGWVVADQQIITQMARAMQAAVLHASSMDQQVLYQLLTNYDIDAHIDVIRREYHKRMLHMKNLITEYIKVPMHWNEPKGGMFFWAEMPRHYDTKALLQLAVKEGVAYVPGEVFYPEEPEKYTLRMNFTHTDHDRTVLGMQRLAKAIEQYEASLTGVNPS